MVFSEKTSNFIRKTGVFDSKYGEKTLMDRNAGGIPENREER